jgi:hypothetical protein
MFTASSGSGSLLATVATKLVLQNFAEEEKSNATKHPLGEKVGWYSTGDDVGRHDRFIFVLFHRRERAENENKQSNQGIEDPQVGVHERTECRTNSRNASKSPSRTGRFPILTAVGAAPEYWQLILPRFADLFAPQFRDRRAIHRVHQCR